MHLATEYFFGEVVMAESTPAEIGRFHKLDPLKEEKIRHCLRGRKKTKLHCGADVRLPLHRSTNC